MALWALLAHVHALLGRVHETDLGVHPLIDCRHGQRSHLGIHVGIVHGGGAAVQVSLAGLGTQIVHAGGVAGDEAAEDGPDEPPGLPQREEGGNDGGTQAPDDRQDDPKPAAEVGCSEWEA